MVSLPSSALRRDPGRLRDRRRRGSPGGHRREQPVHGRPGQPQPPEVEIFDLVPGGPRPGPRGDRRLQLPWVSSSLEREFYRTVRAGASAASSAPPRARSASRRALERDPGPIQPTSATSLRAFQPRRWRRGPICGARIWYAGARPLPPWPAQPAAPPLPGSLESYTILRPGRRRRSGSAGRARCAPAWSILAWRSAAAPRIWRAIRDNPRLLFQLGRALDIAERFDEARHFYEQAGPGLRRGDDNPAHHLPDRAGCRATTSAPRSTIARRRCGATTAAGRDRPRLPRGLGRRAVVRPCPQLARAVGRQPWPNAMDQPGAPTTATGWASPPTSARPSTCTSAPPTSARPRRWTTSALRCTPAASTWPRTRSRPTDGSGRLPIWAIGTALSLAPPI